MGEATTVAYPVAGTQRVDYAYTPTGSLAAATYHGAAETAQADHIAYNADGEVASETAPRPTRLPLGRARKSAWDRQLEGMFAGHAPLPSPNVRTNAGPTGAGNQQGRREEGC